MPDQTSAAIIVTYNRSNDLRNSLLALTRQTSAPDHIIVVNNASTDDTEEVLQTLQAQIGEKLHIIIQETNTGGAGGYHRGMQEALKLPVQWFWLLDDDAVVDEHALEELLLASKNTTGTFCTACISSRDHNTLCWPPSRNYQTYDQLSDITIALFAPFLGFFIHRETVEKIGLPDAEYFISGDDFEYSLRIKKIGGSIKWVKKSRLFHPAPEITQTKLFGKTIKHLHLPSWRRYYDVRNRLWTARKHNSGSWVCAVFLSIITHWLLTLLLEKDALAQTKAYLKAIKHGLFCQRTDTKFP